MAFAGRGKRRRGERFCGAQWSAVVYSGRVPGQRIVIENVECVVQEEGKPGAGEIREKKEAGNSEEYKDEVLWHLGPEHL